MAARSLMHRVPLLLALVACCITVSCEKKGNAPQVSDTPESAARPSEATQTATVKNTGDDMPLITNLALKPAAPRKGDEIEVKVETKDNNGAGDLQFEWSINDNVLHGEFGPNLKTNLNKRDLVTVRVTPTRGGMAGISVSRTVMVVNAPPAVKAEFADMQLKGKSYSFRVQAEDPDGDALTYALLSGPPGMTIDPKTGVVSGEYSETVAGEQKMKVSVKDSDNAETQIEIPVNFGFSAPHQPPRK